jgi:hypothetical protein
MPATQQIGGEDREEALRVFHERLDTYAALHQKLEEGLPPRGSERSSFSALLFRRYLATAIRTARWKARPGDLFTPAAAQAFPAILADVYATSDGQTFSDLFRQRAARPVACRQRAVSTRSGAARSGCDPASAARAG